MPEQDDRPNPPFMGGGGGGSSNDYESRANIAIDWPAGRLFHHFATQVTDQDWTLDSESVGGVLSTGTWTKTTAQGVGLLGILSVLEQGEENYEMRFRVLRRNAGAGPAVQIRSARIVDEVVQ